MADVSNRNRQPEGQSIGGQFAHEHKGESSVELGGQHPEGGTGRGADVPDVSMDVHAYFQPWAREAVERGIVARHGVTAEQIEKAREKDDELFWTGDGTYSERLKATAEYAGVSIPAVRDIVRDTANHAVDAGAFEKIPAHDWEAFESSGATGFSLRNAHNKPDGHYRLAQPGGFIPPGSPEVSVNGDGFTVHRPDGTEDFLDGAQLTEEFRSANERYQISHAINSLRGEGKTALQIPDAAPETGLNYENGDFTLGASDLVRMGAGDDLASVTWTRNGSRIDRYKDGTEDHVGASGRTDLDALGQAAQQWQRNMIYEGGEGTEHLWNKGGFSTHIDMKIALERMEGAAEEAGDGRFRVRGTGQTTPTNWGRAAAESSGVSFTSPSGGMGLVSVNARGEVVTSFDEQALSEAAQKMSAEDFAKVEKLSGSLNRSPIARDAVKFVTENKETFQRMSAHKARL